MIRKAVICTIAIVFLLCQPVRANQTNSVTKVKESIVKHSLEIGVDPALALSIAKSESGFKHESKSSNGAVGVFQLLPSTAQRLGVNPYYLSDNIRGGLMYYKKLYDMFGSTELALAAYNAGPGNVKKYKAVPPFKETRRFVNEIMTEYNNQKKSPDPVISNAGKSKIANNAKVSNAKNEINTEVPAYAIIKSLMSPAIDIDVAAPVSTHDNGVI